MGFKEVLYKIECNGKPEASVSEGAVYFTKKCAFVCSPNGILHLCVCVCVHVSFHTIFHGALITKDAALNSAALEEILFVP